MQIRQSAKPLIQTENRNPHTRKIDTADSLTIARLINNEDKKIAGIIAKSLKSIATGIDMIAASFDNGGRLFYFGAGTSGRLGILDASECVPTFGVDETVVQGFIAGGEYAIRHAVEGAEDSAVLAEKDFITAAVTNRDIVVCISASGNAEYLLTILKLARAKGAKTIALTSNPKAGMNALADLVICTPTGAEVITGSTRMKAGTAQKMVLNMLLTGAMVRIGKTYENLMVDVMAVTDKLKKRAICMVATLAGASPEDAEKALRKTNYKVKPAILNLKYGLSPKQAEQELKENGGKLRTVFAKRDPVRRFFIRRGK